MTKRPAARVLDAVFSHQWAMQEDHLRALLEVASREPGPALEALAAKNDKPLDNSQTTTVRDGIAIVPVVGPLFRYANIFTALSGASSMEVLATDFMAAVNDPRVRAIVVNHDTPGGEVNGVSEMASLIRSVQGRKPIVAYASHLCCSGGYWIASACDEVIVNKTALVGSIGAVLTVRDTRAIDEARGIKTFQFVSAGSPDKRTDPQTDAGAASLQALVDRLGEEFVAAVADHRGVSIEKVLADFGRGGVLVGEDSVRAGMADSVGTLEEVIAHLSSTASPARGAVRFSNRSAGAAAKKESGMKFSTVAELEAAFPDLVKAIREQATTAANTANATANAEAIRTAEEAGRKAGHAAGLEEGKASGAKAERERVLGIQKHKVAGAEKIIDAAIADGTSTPDQAAARVLAELQAAGPRKFDAIKADQAPTVPAAPTGGNDKAAEVSGADVAKMIKAEIAEAAAKGETLSVAAASIKVKAKLAAAA